MNSKMSKNVCVLSSIFGSGSDLEIALRHRASGSVYSFKITIAWQITIKKYSTQETS